MSINPIHPYDYPASQANDFQRKGHPGKFLKSITCTSGTTYFTGSNYGVGGIIVADTTTGTVTLSAGGSISLEDIAGSKRILEISAESVTVNSGTVYVLIKNQISK